MVELNQSLEEKKLKLESLGDQKLIDSINARISYLEESTKTAVDIFKQIGFDNYNSVTEDEYDCAIRQIDSFNAILHLLRNQYSHNLIQDALKIYRVGKSNIFHLCQARILLVIRMDKLTIRIILKDLQVDI